MRRDSDTKICRGPGSWALTAPSRSGGSFRSGRALLSADEENALIAASKAGDERATNRLLLLFRPMIARIARRNCGRDEDRFLDAFQDASIGFVRAIRKHDAALGRLSTYARRWMMSETARGLEIRTNGRCSPPMARIRRHVARSADPDAAFREACARERVRESDAIPYVFGAFRLDAPSALTGEALIETISGDHPDAEEAVERDEKVRALTDAIGTVLSSRGQRERDIVEMRILSEDPATLKAVATLHGVTPERIRQVEKDLRERIGAELLMRSAAQKRDIFRSQRTQTSPRP